MREERRDEKGGEGNLGKLVEGRRVATEEVNVEEHLRIGELVLAVDLLVQAW